MEPQRKTCVDFFFNFWTFIVLFFVSSSLGAVCFSYVITSVQSVERQFQIPSKLSGSLVAANDVGYLTTVIFLSYFGSKGNRVKWIASGFIILSVGCLLVASPHLIFSGGMVSNFSDADVFSEINAAHIYANDANMKHAIDWFRDNNASLPFLNGSNPFGCPKSAENPFSQLTDMNLSSLSDRDIRELFDKSIILSDTASMCRMKKYAASSLSTCNPVGNELRWTIKSKDCEGKQTNTLALIILFIGIVLIGSGTSMPWTLGMPLVDDAVKKRSAPLYFGFMMMVKILGPVLGFLLGAQLNGKWFTLSDPPQGMNQTDPMWIGAWWLGFIIIGVSLLIPSLPLMFFPAHVITERNKELGKTEENETMVADANLNNNARTSITSQIKDFLSRVKAIMKCKVFMGCIIGRFVDMLAFKGYFVFMPKFIETQFAVNMRVSNRLIGTVTAIPYLSGIGVGGLILRKFQLSGRKVTILILITSLVCTVFIFIGSTIRCDSVNRKLDTISDFNAFNMTLPCNLDCNCAGTRVSPVCDRKGNVYFNPCYAGCVTTGSDSRPEEDTFKYHVCKCTDDESEVSKSYCEQNCRIPLIAYFSLMGSSAFINGLSIIPTLLLMLRSVKETDRSLALGLAGFLANLMGTLPSPIVYGFLIDGVCILRGETCAGPQTGSCEVYDTDSFSLRLHLFHGILRLFGMLFDIFVIYHAANIDLFGEEQETVIVEKPASEVFNAESNVVSGQSSIEHT